MAGWIGEVTATTAFTRKAATPTSRSLHWSLAVLTLVSFLNYLDRMVLAVLLPPIRQELHLTDTQLGLLSGLAFALLFAVLGLPLARIADRRSRVGLLGICLAVWSAMTALTGFASSFAQLFLVRVGVGVGEAGCIPAAHSLLGDYFPRRRAMAISVFQAGALAGVSAGLLITGILAQHFGWRAALMLVGAAGLPVTLLVLTLREPVRQGGVGSMLAEPAFRSMSGLMRRGGFAHLVAAISIGGFGNYGIGQWLPSFYVRSFGLTLQQVGAWTGMAAAVGGIGGVLCGGALAVRLMPRDPRWEVWLPMIAYPAAAPLYALMFLSPSLPLAIAMNVAGGFVVAMGGGVALSSLQSFAEPHRRALAVALAMFASSLIGLGLGPLGVGMLSDALARVAGIQSLRYALLGSTVTLLWAGLHFRLAARRYERDRFVA